MKTLKIGIAGYEKRGTLVPRVPYEQVRLDLSLTSTSRPNAVTA